jgi:diacylglycerol kinase family enzyme
VKVLGERPPPLEVVCAEGRREQGVAVIAGNGSLYAGQFKFFRNANNRDSKLDVLVYKEAGYRLVLDSLRGLACGGIDQVDSTSAFQTEAFTVRAEREVPVQVDGEWLGRFAEVRFKEARHHLRVIAPESALTGSFAESLQSLLPWPRRQPELQTTRSR